MRRLNGLYPQICSLENLHLADEKARKGKGHQYGIKIHDKNRLANVANLRETLLAGNYKTSAYKQFKIYEPKERDIFCLPYFPDRITHHAILNVLQPVFMSCFTADSYSSIAGKGIHAASLALQKALLDTEGTKYCLKLDIRKFYPSIDHCVLKTLLRRKFKDEPLLKLLDEIIDSAEGVPIGNYLSQYFANFYLTSFDHWIKQSKAVKHYFRYADDIVILSNSKEFLHSLLSEIKNYLHTNLRLAVKDNYQVFPVAARGIDFVGYVFFHTHVLLRKTIKKRFAKAIHKGINRQSLAAYKGWTKHCDSKHLVKRLKQQYLKKAA